MSCVLAAGAEEGAPEEVPGTHWDLPVVATWTDDPATTANLAFERKTPGTATLSYGPEGAEWRTDVAQAGLAHRHVFKLQGLDPDTVYSYRVASSDGYGQAGTFRTAPAFGAEEAAFSFVFHTDLQGGIHTQVAAEVSAAIVSNEADRLFVLSTGDLGDNRYSADFYDCVASWEKFFAATSNELASSIFLPVAGNHDEPENPDSFWYRLLEHPEDGRDFVMDVGPIRFIGIDSSEFEIPSRTPWLARVLQAAAADPGVLWTIPVLHRPPYSWGERGGQEQVRAEWVPLFVRYEASLVLSGHAHTYQRMKPIDGVPYLVSGGGGAWLYPIDASRPEVALATSCYHYVRFDLGADGALALTAKTPDGSVFDTCTYPAPRRRVRVSPAFPRRGQPCTITYDPGDGPLAEVEQVYLQAGSDDWRTVFLREPMERLDDGCFQAVFTVPVDPKWRISFCFRDADGAVWDNNHTLDWQAILAPPGAAERY